MATNSVKKRPMIVLAIVLCLILTYSYFPKHEVIRNIPRPATSTTSIDRTIEKDWPLLPELQDFWSGLSLDLEASRPRNSPPRRGPRSKNETQNIDTLYSIEMTKEEELQMRDAHNLFVRYAETQSLYGLYTPGSKGIVTTAGGSYVQILLVSLKMLRKTGSQLPVEVFLDNDKEYDKDLCENILPSLNARCRVLSHVLLKAQTPLKIQKYQFKIFSILFSSFEDVIFIDADNLPATDPIELLSTPEYEETGMVLWPDFWGSTISDKFYAIRGDIPPGETGTKTIESGQILVSKKKHAKSLILSSYYNIFGPKYYYPLLSRGAPGEGDKETFSVAADYYRLPYHLIEIGVRAIGHFDREHDNQFKGGCMMQSFPESSSLKGHPKPAFMHANFPKMNPSDILDKGNTNWKDGTTHRMWHELDKGSHLFSWGGDPEKSVFNTIAEVACSYPRFVSGGLQTCKRLRKHISDLFGP